MTELTRKCDGCTACCEGWLEGVAHGKPFYPGRPCHFSGCDGCSIYEYRPESPCKTYSCEWLVNNDVPEWMKPDRSKVIITRREYTTPSGTTEMYLDVAETGEKIDSTVLNWLLGLHIAKQVQLRIQIAGGLNWYGTKDFLDATGCKVAL